MLLAVGLSACSNHAAETAEISEMAQTDEAADVEEKEESEEEFGQIGTEAEPEETEETEEDTAQKEREKLEAALGKMPYYGDAAQCKMTAEQATAYAQLIADGLAGDFSFRGGYEEHKVDIRSWGEPFEVYDYLRYFSETAYMTDRADVMLGDFAGDGIPYLYLSCSLNPDAYERVADSFEVYGWVDHAAKLAVDAGWYAEGKCCLYEDENEEGKIKFYDYYHGETTDGAVSYSFSRGTITEDSQWWAVADAGSGFGSGWTVTENDVETAVYTKEVYYTLLDEQERKLTGQIHMHTLPGACFYDMEPCSLEEMVSYLNAYAAVMSDGQSVPVTIQKTDIVEHDGTGIIAKEDMPRWKVHCLDVLRKYRNGEEAVGYGNADSTVYTDFGEGFYFLFSDINDDGDKELVVQACGHADVWASPLYDSMLDNVCGVNKEDGTYHVIRGSVTTIEEICSFGEKGCSTIAQIEGEEPLKDSYLLTQGNVTRKVDGGEVEAIMQRWHDQYQPIDAGISFNIENIESTFDVKITTLDYSGKWRVSDTI